MLSTMGTAPLSQATLLRHGAELFPGTSISTWTGSGFRHADFARLGRDGSRLAHVLSGLGVALGDRVGTFMWNNYEHLLAYHAIPAMGAVIHPLNIRLLPAQVGFVATQAADRVVLVDGSLLETFLECLPEMPTVERVVVVDGPLPVRSASGVEFHSFETLMREQSEAEYPYPSVDEYSAAAICYTSGTTGNPKGVVYSHRSNWLHAMFLCSANGLAIGRCDTVLPVVPMFHANGWGLPHACLMAGAALLLPDRFVKPTDLLSIMEEGKPTFAAAVPTVWTGVLAELDSRPQDIGHLREVMVGGAALPHDLMAGFRERYGVQLMGAWGMTETSPLVTVARPPVDCDAAAEPAYRVSQGKIPVGVDARLVDEGGIVLPRDGRSVGELQVRGPWITSSYYTGAAEPQGMDSFEDGWLRTGDVGYITADGFLTLVDRAKDLIKSGGEWISSIQLENDVMSHPDVAEATVVGVPDDKWGERPLVVVVLKERAEPDPVALRAHLIGKFAKWQLPDLWTFVREIPKTSVGKFDKKRIRDAFEPGSPIDLRVSGQQ
ncbi:AMP-binding enzyme family protein [Rhodococcus sp. MTM3W5.2]|uniref:long-chain fatty acid--CoA ligase n=1 Tax=Rhodococcus sp. MTM3W5.2 TaxID=1805827 RepID=UPI00097932C3|nr:long-chain fatty acid--CoA ligase [Rhodococcus sp. MTM3W5.2]AQA24919.1 AMP-binding enzyme family protein [Rhodococcus sp. MTM3W5.2]